MKKLIAISLVLTLVAGAAFAELTVGGAIGAGANVVSGSSAKDSVLGAGPTNSHWGRLQGTYANDEGTFGAHVKIAAMNEWWANPFAFAWWKPISQIRVFGGANPFGEFGINYIVGWGWHASDAEDYVAYNGYGFTRSAWSYAGWDVAGFALTLAPVEGLAINVAVPYERANTTEAAEIYNHTVAQVTYDIANVGQIAVTYQSGAGYRNWDTSGGITNDPGSISAQFYLSGVQNLQLNIGLKYIFAGETEVATVKTTYTPPIAAGFGLNYNVSDTIGVKARLAAGFAGATETADVTTTDGTYYNFKLGFDLMPYFDLSILKLFLNLGIEYNDEQKKGDNVEVDSAFGWYFNPYITKSVGGGTFYAGFQLASDGYEDANEDIPIKWSIPIGIQVGF
jgi:hypothetical protein